MIIQHITDRDSLHSFNDCDELLLHIVECHLRDRKSFEEVLEDIRVLDGDMKDLVYVINYINDFMKGIETKYVRVVKSLGTDTYSSYEFTVHTPILLHCTPGDVSFTLNGDEALAEIITEQIKKICCIGVLSSLSGYSLADEYMDANVVRNLYRMHPR